MSSPMLPLWTEATIEEKTNTCTYRHRPTYIDLLQNEAKLIISYGIKEPSNQHTVRTPCRIYRLPNGNCGLANRVQRKLFQKLLCPDSTGISYRSRLKQYAYCLCLNTFVAVVLLLVLNMIHKNPMWLIGLKTPTNYLTNI